jgi:hypothetical protein
VYLVSELGLDNSQIGLLALLRPWVAVPAGLILVGAADRWRWHKATLATAFAVSTLLRAGLPLAASFPAAAAILLLGDVVGAPVGSIADAAIIGACRKARAAPADAQRLSLSHPRALCPRPP